nr:hypothetical protein [Cytophagales bacterium]
MPDTTMQKLELPQALNDIRAKIKLLEDRLVLIQEGIELYQTLAAKETDLEKNYTLREQASKKQEEQVVYYEQLRSQQVYLTEFEKDLKQQQDLRQKQLTHIKEHKQQVLDSAKELLKSKDLPEAERVLIKSLREQFVKDQFSSNEERIARFRELVNTLQKTAA